MCASGQIQYTGTTTGYYTHDKVYDIITVTTTGGPDIDAAFYLIRADNGTLNNIRSNDTDFTLTALSFTTKAV